MAPEEFELQANQNDLRGRSNLVAGNSVRDNRSYHNFFYLPQTKQKETFKLFTIALSIIILTVIVILVLVILVLVFNLQLQMALQTAHRVQDPAYVFNDNAVLYWLTIGCEVPIVTGWKLVVPKLPVYDKLWQSPDL